jgi:hypothetical protein
MDKAKHTCGEIMVCPKCEPLIQQTNCINVRFKGKYNGGLPNHLVVFPSYCTENSETSVAVIIGDNFFKKGHYVSRSMKVESMARWIANSDWSYMSGVFDLEKHHKPMFADLQDKLREYLGSISGSESIEH